MSSLKNVFKSNNLKKKPVEVVENNCVYEGQWRECNDGTMIIWGKGRMVWPSGEMYEGHWVKGYRHG